MSVTASLAPVSFFNDTATTEIYTLSLHDALPISARRCAEEGARVAISDKHERRLAEAADAIAQVAGERPVRSEEHTSELQSRQYFACRLLLEQQSTPPQR